MTDQWTVAHPCSCGAAPIGNAGAASHRRSCGGHWLTPSGTFAQLDAEASDAASRDDNRPDERVARLYETTELLQGMVYQLAIVERYATDAVPVPELSRFTGVVESAIRATQARIGTALLRLEMIRRDRCPDCGHTISELHAISGCRAIMPTKRLPITTYPPGTTIETERCRCPNAPTPESMFAGSVKSWTR